MGDVNADDSRLQVIAYDPQYRDRYNFNDESDDDQVLVNKDNNEFEEDELKMISIEDKYSNSHSISRKAQLQKQKSLERQRAFHQNRSRYFVNRRSNSDITSYRPRSNSNLFPRSKSPLRPHHRYQHGHIQNEHHNHHLPRPTRFAASLSLPEIRRNKSDMDLCVGDEWIECGDNLRIAPEIHSGSNKITNIAKIKNQNNYYRGSGFASNVVYKRTHYWKLRVNSSQVQDFAIGFIADGHGRNKRNSSFLAHRKSVGIYSNKNVWSDNKKLRNSKGIEMRNRDIINIALDMDHGYVYVQRCKYDINKQEYDVNEMKKLSGIKIKSDDLHNGYRLACYLKQKGQSLTIVEYSDNRSFPEWR